MLFRHGDEAEHLYILVEGRVDFLEINASLGPGQMFGEIAFFSPERRRTVTARLRRGLRAPQHRPEHGAPALLPEPGLRLRDRRSRRRPPLGRRRAPARPARRAAAWRDASRSRAVQRPRQLGSVLVFAFVVAVVGERLDRVVVAGDRLGGVERVLRAGDAVGRDVGAVARALGNRLGALAGAARSRCRCPRSTGVAPPVSWPSSGSVFRRVAPWMSLPLSEVSLGPSVSASRPGAC